MKEETDGEGQSTSAASTGDEYQPSSFDKTNLWEKLTYSFVYPLVRKGLTKILQLDDLDQVSVHDRAKKLTDTLEAEWDRELHTAKHPSLWRALYRAHRPAFWQANLLYTLDTLILIIKPVLLREIVIWLGEEKDLSNNKHWDVGTGYGLVIALSILGILQAFTHHASYFVTMRTGWRLRTATMGLLEKKILKLSSQWQAQASTGQVVSIIANDCQRYDEFAIGVPFLWISPLSAVVGLLIVIEYVGWPAALAGCAATIGVMPIQVLCGQEVGQTRRRTALLTDKRVKIMAEILSGIQTVKAFVWEEPFRKSVSAIRALERQSIAWAMLMKAITMAILFVAPSLSAFVTFVAYWALGNPLDLPTVFAVVSLLQVLISGVFGLLEMSFIFPLLLHRETARWIPRSIEVTAEGHVATVRIRHILMLPEVEDVAGVREKTTSKRREKIPNDAAAVSRTQNGGRSAAAGRSVEGGRKEEWGEGAVMMTGAAAAKDAAVLELDDVSFSWLGKAAALEEEKKEKEENGIAKVPSMRRLDSRTSSRRRLRALSTEDDPAEKEEERAGGSGNVHGLRRVDSRNASRRRMRGLSRGDSEKMLLGDGGGKEVSRSDLHLLVDPKGGSFPASYSLGHPQHGGPSASERSIRRSQRSFRQMSHCCLKSDARKIHVRGVTFRVKPGELVIVVGTVGSGKTTLLDGILGEAACVEGRVSVKAGTRLAYCSQEPWIQAGTVKDNIFFGQTAAGGSSHVINQPIDADQYDEAIRACALDHDLEVLPAGDMTEIGELGINLSGGQRARVALARAVFADADLYLFDDVLSAVDARVSKHLFHSCIRGELRDKAVVLVTHQIQYLPYADRVCLLDPEGHMVDCAPWQQLKSRVPDWKHLVDDDDFSSDGEAEDDGEEGEIEADDDYGEEEDEQVGLEVPVVEKVRPESSVFVQAEERIVGAVQGSTYLTYLQNGGWIFGLFIAFLICLAQGAIMLTDFWLKIWASSSNQSSSYYPKTYAIIMGTTVFLSFLRARLFFGFSLRASTRLHDSAVGAVFASPLSFFSANPHGRILNKFARDLDSADDLLPNTLFDFLQSGFLCLGGVVVGCIAVPWLLLIVAPLGYFFFKYRKEFICTAREVKRIDAITCSPIYADIGATLAGAKVIRAFKAEEAVHRRFLGLLDENGRAHFCFLVISRHLGYRLDMLCAYFVACLCILAVALRASLDPGMIALSLTYALALSGLFQWSIRQSASSETLLTSVERLHHYTILPSEGPRHNSKYLPPTDWPSKGDLTVHDLNVRYREDLPIVLKDVRFSIPGGKKVGIVGRTGSGKSSFLAAMLRLNEIVSGDIILDGVSLTRLGLADSRSGVSWIPQVPNLFAGTLRFNLDPFSEFTDAEIWSALRDVELKGLTRNLKMPISEGGGNLSVGQRQLLSLARAVLLRRKVLLMDEATANVDYITDALIQKTLKSSPAFKGCTIIVIAHRIKTVLDSDVVILFSDGKLVEQGIPAELLADGRSVFASMVKEAEGCQEGGEGV